MRTFCTFFGLTLLVVLLTFTVGCVYNYFYPMKYSEEIISIAEECNLESSLIASIINVESNFNEHAVSNKGAVGVMQILPSTAEWIAKKNNKNYREEYLKDAKYNIELGSYYLAYLIDYFGDVQLGICAYNAGQGNVSNWLKNKEYSKDGKSLQKIPFKETREYVNKVNKNYHYYKNRYK